MMESDNESSAQVATQEEVNKKREDGSSEGEMEEDGDSTHSDGICNEPRVPLHVDPEFVDPRESKFKFGMIYLSYIPDGLNVKILRELMGQFGEVGRIYLEPEDKDKGKEQERKKRRSYSEGWIEFKKKRVAKSVAKTLNGTPLQFKWAHLADQLAHNKAVRDQKRSFEMSQAKKQSDFYQKMTERSKMLKKYKQKPNDEKGRGQDFNFKQNKSSYKGEEQTVPVDEDLLTSIFRKVA